MTRRPGCTWVPLPVAARRLRLRMESVAALVRGGRVTGRLVGGRRWFVRSDSLERLLQRQRRKVAGGRVS